MNSNVDYIKAFQNLTAFKVKFKVDSPFQRLLSVLVSWYIPTYLTHYTTAIGQSIYFPSRTDINKPVTKFIIAHEVVHLLDQERLTIPIFLLLYLSPQIFAIGILSFPWLGIHALWFLIFALPWPSPGRLWLEARAYGLEMNLYVRSGYKIDPQRYADIFVSADYYFMSWSKKYAMKCLLRNFEAARIGKNPVFSKVIKVYDQCQDRLF